MLCFAFEIKLSELKKSFIFKEQITKFYKV